ncbi:MAG: DUF2147 domain-containing protein [Bacteroidales bacterium]|nr:DUF2147 domain-containing protein [Bacteroidales bacterium]
MKKLLLTAMTILFVPLFLHAQANIIEGTWYNDEKTSTIEITKGADGKYVGKISWLEEPNEDGKPKVDKENSDPKLAKRPLLGLSIVKNFVYDSNSKQWEKGSIYDPDNGKTYDCFAWFEDGNNNKLYLKGYVAGIKALGRKTIWTRKN